MPMDVLAIVVNRLVADSCINYDGEFVEDHRLARQHDYDADLTQDLLETRADLEAFLASSHADSEIPENLVYRMQGYKDAEFVDNWLWQIPVLTMNGTWTYHRSKRAIHAQRRTHLRHSYGIMMSIANTCKAFRGLVYSNQLFPAWESLFLFAHGYGPYCPITHDEIPLEITQKIYPGLPMYVAGQSLGYYAKERQKTLKICKVESIASMRSRVLLYVYGMKARDEIDGADSDRKFESKFLPYGIALDSIWPRDEAAAIFKAFRSLQKRQKTTKENKLKKARALELAEQQKQELEKKAKEKQREYRLKAKKNREKREKEKRRPEPKKKYVDELDVKIAQVSAKLEAKAEKRKAKKLKKKRELDRIRELEMELEETKAKLTDMQQKSELQALQEDIELQAMQEVEEMLEEIAPSFPEEASEEILPDYEEDFQKPKKEMPAVIYISDDETPVQDKVPVYDLDSDEDTIIMDADDQ